MRLQMRRMLCSSALPVFVMVPSTFQRHFVICAEHQMERTKFRQEGLGEETEFLKDTCPAPPGAVDQVEECQPTKS